MKTTAELEKEIAQLKHIVFTLRGYVLVLHRQTSHNKIGKREHTTCDLHEINMINDAIKLDIERKEWEV